MASAIGSVLANLSVLIIQEVQLLGSVHGEVQSLKDEFQHMMAFLERADLLVQDYPHLRSWVDLVRDGAFDVEDVLDEFVMCNTYRVVHDVNDVLDESVKRCMSRHFTILFRAFKKMYTNYVGTIVAQHQLATKIQKIKKRVKGISETHERYRTQYQYLLPEQTLSLSFSPAIMWYDKRGDALFLDDSDLVGIDVPKKELIDLLFNGDVRRNVISVVGMGGLGKTTLVKKVYEDVSVKRQFNYHAWITVSESFKLEVLFKDAIKQLFGEDHREIPQDVDDMDINRLKGVVRDFLRTKKYIVVFDDVWKINHWDAIHLAFPRNQFGSRVVVTTRSNVLSQAASATEAGGAVYVVRPLQNTQARQLFCRKAFAGAILCPKDLEEICEKILSACEGLPLAIQVIGSVLARKSQLKEEWELFYKSLSAEMDRNSQLDPMVKLLSLSYYDLPKHLKVCFLYLSIFPEDAKVMKEDLAHLWIAEGFVENVIGMTLQEVACRYLNELVDRCLLQVVLTDLQGSMKAFRIHDIIRRIIILKASQQNIATFCGEEGMSLHNNVRRLSIHGLISGNLEQAQSYCKSIRSVILFDNVGDNITESSISNLLSHGRKLVKVLKLSDAELDKIPDEIFKLFHLTYLCLINTNVSSVPRSIGMLQNLQTFNLLGTRVIELPVEIQKLQHLRVLTMGRIHPNSYLEKFEQVQGARASFRIGNLRSLHTLRYIDADQVDNIRIVTEIGKLIQLRMLGITKLKREDGNELCSSLGYLTELRELFVYSVNEEEVIDFQHLRSTDLPRLQQLNLTGRLENSPRWISYLHGLTVIDLQCSMLRDDPLECLQDLPSLFTLILSLAYEGETLFFKSGKFSKLEILHVRFLRELRCVTVEENAMPFLRNLLIHECPSMEEIPTGIENLMHLKHVEMSNMSNVFVNNLEELDKQSAAYKRLLQVPQVALATWSDSGLTEIRYLNKDTGTFNNEMT